MSISTNQEVLPTLEDMHVGLRQITCECGCGQMFFQAQVGRVRKYIDSKHKAAAYRAKRAESGNKPSLGDTVRELLDYMDSVFEVEHSLEWLDHDEVYALTILASAKPETRVALCNGLDALYERYCK